jgi:hypothetical protein
MAQLGQAGVLQFTSEADLQRQDAQRAAQQAAATQPAAQDVTSLVTYIRGQYEIFRNHRNTAGGWSERLLKSLRAFVGQYEQSKLHQIRQFGGSEVYVRVTAQKCRAASSLLRDIYLGPDRPYAIRAPVSPPIPQEVQQKINSLLMMEQKMVAQSGQPLNPSDFVERRRQLLESATDAAKKNAVDQARDSEDKVEEMLREGDFYRALAECIVDIPIFPFCVLKGPVVRVKPVVTWPRGGGQPTVQMVPTLTWQRASPFDLWFTPGVSDPANANFIEKMRVTRGELDELLDLPGYDRDEILAVLAEYGRGGLYDNWDTTDAERAVLENKENPAWNRSALISVMEFNGNVQGRILMEYGVAAPGMANDPDGVREYHVQCWIVGNHVIKCQLSPSPRKRAPYYITSFEKVPGTIVGNSLTDLLEDIQEVINADVRALVNNLSIASGPQVIVDDSQLSPQENGEDMWPWKRWHVRNDPSGAVTGRKPIDFFQPQTYAQQLIEVYKTFLETADDVSAIPKYIGGQASSGGAGRTASGLAMLMGNASKILQSVSANIDRDMVEPALQQLTDLILLTDTSGMLTGEEKITVQGVNVAIQRETLRQRQVEFLQATNNPTDMHIMGIAGRGRVLRAVATPLGIDGETIVPPDQVLDQMETQQKQQQAEGPLMQQVEKGIQGGVEQGLRKITTELTAGLLAARLQMPEGMPTHIGTLPEHNGGGVEEAARVASGTKPTPVSTQHMGPQTSLVGNQPGPTATPVQGGVG